MTTRYGLVVLVAFAVVGALAWSGAAQASTHEGASLEAARSLYAERLFESAGLELREIVASDADAETRAAALHLLGRIAVEQGRYGEAVTLWSDLAEGFAGTAAATEAATEKHLVEALVECRGEAPAGVIAEAGVGEAGSGAAASAGGTATRAVPPVSEPPAAPDRRATAPAAAGSPPMPSEAAPAASPTAPTPPVPTAGISAPDEASPARESDSATPPAAAPGAAAAPAPTPGLVLVAGRGKPYDAVREAIGEFTGFLVERGVAAESPTEGIALVEESASALERLLEAARERGAESLLHVEAQFGHRERIEIECYRPDGELLWREKVTGGMGFSERTMNEKLVRRLEEKLAERVGGPGLPVGGSAGR